MEIGKLRKVQIPVTKACVNRSTKKAVLSTAILKTAKKIKIADCYYSSQEGKVQMENEPIKLKSISESFHNRKQLQCPICGRRLMDTEESTQAEAKILAQSIHWHPDLYIKCWKCSSKIGIKVNK